MRDICRNFQRGSCQYGERCRYLHVNNQQRKPNVQGFGGQNGSHQQQSTNPFGFGSGSGSQQQQKSNPFGFGTQNNSQLNGGPRSEYKPNQYKPFENKWNRQSSKPQNGGKSDNNPQPVDHKCTDPENCKRQIAEDFEKEKPIWILTCYGHFRGAPCDIVGDISFEELRASAYEDAKRGMSLQSIVEKERNILKSKMLEFQKLLSEPYQKPINSSLDIQRPQSMGANANLFSGTSQSNGPLSVSSFSQLGTSMNMGFGRPSAPPTNTLAQPSFFGIGGNSLASNTGNLTTSGSFGIQSNPHSTPVDMTMFPGSTQQTPATFNNSGPNTMFQTTSDVLLSKKLQSENVSGDVSIWLKEKWNPGEIPEEAPPDSLVR
ncbi:zinc finger CCCH domain-containing protein 46 [Vigna unguiculata]|uniref:Nucleoporin-like protein 2 n=1 Tax=Vigna unguiculata TaxID=3917 RepID=A0A4D6LJX2_VIGUN|nr:zinc finger CCCH domain-containing protein 46 [Vigna unguiculata]QCD88881.1 nucleoporin-like protein 2 [Vigna unguiculata]